MTNLETQDTYQVRFNGLVILETASRGEAEEEYYSRIASDPQCECAIIFGLDAEGDEYKLEAYSG